MFISLCVSCYLYMDQFPFTCTCMPKQLPVGQDGGEHTVELKVNVEAEHPVVVSKAALME